MTRVIPVEDFEIGGKIQVFNSILHPDKEGVITDISSHNITVTYETGATACYGKVWLKTSTAKNKCL